MKRLSISLLSTMLLSFCISSSAQDNNVRQISNTNDTYPYKIANTNIKMGKSDYSKTILNAWHLYDKNQLDDIAAIIADTVTAGLPDGTMLKGKANFLNSMKTYRGGFNSVVSTVNAVTTLKAGNDPNHEVTVIWGTETDTKKDGTVQKMAIHEVWIFNKEGMVCEFYQYAIPMMEKK